MFLGAMADMYKLTNDEAFLHDGARVLDAVVSRMAGDPKALTRGSSLPLVLREPVGLTLASRKCDAMHDPSAPGGGDLFSFKGVFMQQLPRYVSVAKSVLTKPQLAAANQLVADSAEAAWGSRQSPPFASSDVCNEFGRTPSPAGSRSPKFTWDWKPARPDDGSLSCLDARTQAQTLSLFVAKIRLGSMLRST